MTQPAASSSSDLPAAVDALTAEMLALFTVAEQQMLAALASLGDTADAAVLLLAMQREAVRRARLLQRRVPALAQRITARAARMAEQDADAELTRAGVTPPPRPPRPATPTLTPGPRPHRVDLLRDLPPARRAEADDLTRRLLATVQRFARFADDAYRAAIVGQLGPVFAGESTTQLAQQAAWRQLTERGVTGFVDRKGRQWNLASYVEMATRTAITRTYNAAHLERLVASGIEQVAVPSTGHPCPLCRPWEGMVLSIDPAGPSPTIAEAEAAGLHHPNCRHTWIPYIPGRTRIPRPKAWTDQDARLYAATQQLRGLERRVRALRRAEVGAGNPLDARRARAARLTVQKEIRDHADRHGLVRRPRREQLDLDNGRPPAAGGGGTKPPAPPKPPTGGGGGEPPDGTADREARRARMLELGIDHLPSRDVLTWNELAFVERFRALGHSERWLPTSPQMKPVNDFVWIDRGGLEFEQKTTKARYPPIFRHLLNGAQQHKDRFIVDLGDEVLDAGLRHELGGYNVDRREHRIAELWVMSGAGSRLEQIELRT
jgi:hypothetical protein